MAGRALLEINITEFSGGGPSVWAALIIGNVVLLLKKECLRDKAKTKAIKDVGCKCLASSGTAEKNVLFMAMELTRQEVVLRWLTFHYSNGHSTESAWLFSFSWKVLIAQVYYLFLQSLEGGAAVKVQRETCIQFLTIRSLRYLVKEKVINFTYIWRMI